MPSATSAAPTWTSSGSVTIDTDVASKGQRYGMRLLKAPPFENGMGALILFNMVLIIVETDHGVNNDSGLAWVEALGWMMLLIFVLELALRLYVLRTSFWHDRANTVDFVIVVTDTCFSLLGIAFGSVFPVSILRVFRLGKLARVSKVFRICPELRIMMAGLVGSLKSIFWGAVLLAFFLLVWSIIAVQFIHPLNEVLTEKGYHANCERCPRAYRSVLESTLTFCQQIVAGDSWGEATIPVIEHYPATALYFMAVFLSVGLAVMNLILGVVVSVAQQEHERLKDEMKSEKEMVELETSTHLLDICKEMASLDYSGKLSEEVILKGYKEREDFRTSFTALALEEDDIPIVWSLVDVNKSGLATSAEFVNKVYKMKNKDSNYMLQYMKFYINSIHDSIQSLLNEQHNQIDQLVKLEEQEIGMLRHLEQEQQEHQDGCSSKMIVPDMVEAGEPRGSLQASCQERHWHHGEGNGRGVGERDGEVKHILGDGPHLRIGTEEKGTFTATLDTLTHIFEHTCRELKEAMQDLRQSVKSHEVSTLTLDVLLQKWTSSVDDLLAACRGEPPAKDSWRASGLRASGQLTLMPAVV